MFPHRPSASARRLLAVPSLVAALLAPTACVACADPAPGDAASPAASAAPGETNAPPSAPPQAASPTTPGLAAPFDALGPFRIGMTEDEARAVLPALKAGPIPTWLVADGYELRFDAGKVKTVRVQLADVGGLRVGDRTIPPEADLTKTASYFQGCSAPEVRIGASIIRCENDAVMVLAGGVSLTVYVGIGEERPSP